MSAASFLPVLAALGFDEVIAGLIAPQKRLPSRLLYDDHGATLFESICELPSYYLTRSELELLAEHLTAIARAVGPHARVIEPGSGAGHKTRMLLSALEKPAVYIPIDVSGEQLEEGARALRTERRSLEVMPVHGDYMTDLRLPRASAKYARTLFFFPGSTIGNFEPRDARRFLARFGALAGPGAALLLGADSNDQPETLLPAYDDPEGVTAAFNRNVLAHVNRTYDATFDLDAFVHRAVWNSAHRRIEMHLVSQRRHSVQVGDLTVAFERGESIVTEHCYKHSPTAVKVMLADGGWHLHRVWVDALGRMRLWLADRA